MKTFTSSSQNFFYKSVIPMIFGFVAGIMALLISTQAVPIYLAVFIGLIVGALANLFARHQASEYADAVIDEGDRIVVRNYGLEESIDLTDIREVDSTMMRPAGVWLHLRRDSVFGRTIKFLPDVSLFSFSKLTKALNVRISQAEQAVAPNRSLVSTLNSTSSARGPED